ncbi:unannotated protein [freshwater metagenome]|uniref:Unannotated protein n=2 Tax=freshwater metagenome TaxID=449393 RepID=A0A6J7C0T3_9ZZZZ
MLIGRTVHAVASVVALAADNCVILMPMSETHVTALEPRGLSDCYTPRTTVLYTLVVFLLDLGSGVAIEYGSVFSTTTTRILNGLDVAMVVAFIATIGVVIVASISGREHLRHRALILYLIVATVQTIAAVAALVVTARVRHDEYLWGLADVGAAYIAIAAVFTGWYWLLDGIVPGGAFVFPGRGGVDLQRPKLIDYAFISFNTNATFGPTSETVVSRRVKVAMMLQTSLSLLVLLVLVARLVQAHGS